MGGGDAVNYTSTMATGGEARRTSGLAVDLVPLHAAAITYLYETADLPQVPGCIKTIEASNRPGAGSGSV